MKSVLGAFAVGLVFALGLGISGMTHPDKVVAFLDVGGAWDPSLALVMGGAFGVHTLLRRRVLKRPAPLLDRRFHLVTRRDIDTRLIGGAALFGVGWGLSGYCPGPAFVSVASGSGIVALFVASMFGGMALFLLVSRRAPKLAPEEGCSPGALE